MVYSTRNSLLGGVSAIPSVCRARDKHVGWTGVEVEGCDRLAMAPQGGLVSPCLQVIQLNLVRAWEKEEEEERESLLSTSRLPLVHI